MRSEMFAARRAQEELFQRNRNLALYITDLINVRTDFRYYFFQKVGGGISKLTELTAGAGFMFDAF